MAKQSKRQRKGKGNAAAKDGLPMAVAKPKGRGSRSVGKLRAMLRVPMDVFVEIASFLEPIDVLQLARTSKHFRDILMSKQSILIWRASWVNVSVSRDVWDRGTNEYKTIPGYIPPCPPGVSEPLLATLVFEHGFCTACGRKTSLDPDLFLRVRACKKCPVADLQVGLRLLRQMRTEMRVPAAVKKSNADYVLFSMVPSKEPMTWFTPGRDYTVEKCNDYNWKELSRNLFASAAFKEITRGYYELLLSNDKGLDAFVEEKQKDVQELWEHTRKVKEYVRRRAWNQEAVDSKLRASFREAVHRELQALGYGKDELKLPKLSWVERKKFDPLVSQKRPFSDKIWVHLQPKLEDFLQQNRREEHKQTLAHRRNHIAELIHGKLFKLTDDEGNFVDGRSYALPSPARLDFAPIKTLLDEKMEDPTYDRMKALPENDWSRLVQGGFLELIEERRDAVTRALLHLLIRGLSGLSAEEVCDILDEIEDPSNIHIASTIASSSSSNVLIPAGFNLHHPAAFFICKKDPFYRPTGDLCSYGDIYEVLDDRHHDKFDDLVRSVQRPQEHLLTRIPYWIGDATGMQLAMALLDNMGYDYSPDENAGDTGSSHVRKHLSMGELLKKGDAFVCMCCPEQSRFKRGWTKLVQHFYEELCFVTKMQKLMSEANRTIPLTNSHDFIIQRVLKTSTGPSPSSSSDSSPPSESNALTLPVPKLIMESPSFVNGPCLPEDLRRTHSHSFETRAPGRSQYTCIPCHTIGQGKYGAPKFESDWLLCAEMHVKTRHKAVVEEGDIQVLSN